MQIISVRPGALVKRLVSEPLVVRIRFSHPTPVAFELYATINGKSITEEMVIEGDSAETTIQLTESGYMYWQVRWSELGTGKWKWLKTETGAVEGEVHVDPMYLADSIVYNVFVRFFNGKIRTKGLIRPGDGGTFDDVKKHLSRLQSMGITTLYFNPIHLIGELYRKYNHMDDLPSYFQPGSPYSIKDYKSIDPELAYDKDSKSYLLSDPAQEFRDLVEAAHEKGMYVYMDMVFNHTAHDFVFQRIRPEWYLYKERINSLEDPYLYPEDLSQGKPWGDPKHTVSPYDHGLWWEDAAQLNWEFMIPDGPNPTPKNPTLSEMWEFFKSIPRYWIRHFGVDGFRCDIAYRVPPAFWKACIAEAREEARSCSNNLAKDVVFIGEAFTDNLKELQEAGFAAVYGDYSNKLARPLELKGYLDYMYNLSGDYFPEGSRWFIFPECHDFNRAPQKVLGHPERFEQDASLRANESRWLLTALLPGVPLIFNGFEKLEWEPVNLFSYGAVDWERDFDLRDFITDINHIRHTYKAFQMGSYRFIQTNQGLTEATQLFAFLREYKKEMFLVIVNMDVHRQAGPADLELPAEFSGSYQLYDHLTKESFDREGQRLTVILPPAKAHIFEVTFPKRSTKTRQ